MQVTQIYTKSPLRNFCYVIHNGTEALAIDAFDGAAMADHLRQQGLDLKAIVNTHHHHDHTCGNAALVAATGAPVWAHPDAAIDGAEGVLAHGHRITLSGSASEGDYVEVLDTPGHTMSHVCLLVVEGGTPKAIVTGDCIFNGGVGNCRNGGHPDALYETVRDVFAPLPDDITVYPGHDYFTNNLQFSLSIDPELGEAEELLAQYPQSEERFVQASLGLERRVSVFFRTDEPRIQSLIAARAAAQGLALTVSDSRGAFLALRQLRDRW